MAKTLPMTQKERDRCTQKLTRQALELYRARYPNYGSLLFAEVLRELWNRPIRKETLLP